MFMGRKNTAFKVLAVIFLAGGIIFFHAYAPVRWIQGKSIDVLRPVMRGTTAAGRWVGRIAGGAKGDELEQLRKENERIRAENFDRGKLAAEVQSLEAALAFRSLVRTPLTGARVLLYESDLGREFLLIDQGMRSGIKKDDVVVDEHGVLVGVIAGMGEDYSRVLVASNPGVAFPIVLTPAGLGAMARGIGARTFSLELIPRASAIRRGDFVARRVPGESGKDRSILVGTISEEAPAASGVFRNAHAVLLARPETLDYVFIIAGSPVSP